MRLTHTPSLPPSANAKRNSRSCALMMKFRWESACSTQFPVSSWPKGGAYQFPLCSGIFRRHRSSKNEKTTAWLLVPVCFCILEDDQILFQKLSIRLLCYIYRTELRNFSNPLPHRKVPTAVLNQCPGKFRLQNCATTRMGGKKGSLRYRFWKSRYPDDNAITFPFLTCPPPPLLQWRSQIFAK